METDCCLAALLGLWAGRCYLLGVRGCYGDRLWSGTDPVELL